MIAVEPLDNAFARLDARNGWRTPIAAPGLLFGSDGVRLGEHARPIADTEASGSFGGRTLPRGVTLSLADGRLFVADPEGQCIRTMLPDAATAGAPSDAAPGWPLRPLWQRPAADAAAAVSDPYALVRPTDVKLAPGGDLVVVDPGAGRLVVLTLPEGAVRKVVPLAEEPTALAFDAAGRAYVVLAAGKRVLRFDCDWQRDPDYHGGDGTLVAPSAIAAIRGALCHCRAGDRCGCAAASAGLPDGTVFVLDQGRVRALDARGHPADIALPEALDPPPLRVAADQSLSWRVPPREALQFPGLVVDRRGRIGGLPLVARARRIVLPKTGSWIAGPFDGGRDRFVWDRVLLDADVPDRTRIVVDSYADDAGLDDTRVLGLGADAWSTPLPITDRDRPEVLIQSPAGRYIWLRLRFVGDGEVTPLVRALELSGPRASSLRFLPVPFHQDPDSASFLDRLLALFDALLDEPAAKGRAIARTLDPDTVAAGAFLDWLGAWFDWTFLAQWPEAVRREMIREAIPYFRKRGTVAGLQQLIRWHSAVPEPWPLVIEHFRLRDRPASPPLYVGGFPLQPAAADCAHRFTIVMPRAFVRDEVQLEALLEAQKPAHTIAELRLVEPGFRIGRQSAIGVDTLIGSAPLLPLGLGHLAQSFATTSGGPPKIGASYLCPPGG